MIEKINNLINQGEGLRIEFKKALGGIPKNVYETVCAFCNTKGGEILLGVDDKGKILGIDKDKVVQYKQEFVSTINDSDKNCPPLYLSIEQVDIAGKVILYINVPESAEVQRCNGKIFIRNEDGDFNMTHQQTNVSNLYLRKQRTYSENKIYKNVTINDLRKDLIARARKLATIRQPGHPWSELNDLELLRSAGLYKKDYISNEEGITLSGILLLGKDEVISSILPHFKTDLIIRVKNKERYDDRDDVRTNLMESYDRTMAFIKKHLPSPFSLEGETRIDIRDIIFREIAANLLVHREYTNHFPAKLIIQEDKIYTENGNKPFIHGNINPNLSTPYPKNPTIAKFFKEIGWAEELGSGVRNIFKYATIYAGYQPTLNDGDVFKFDWQVNIFQETISSDQPSDQPSAQPSDQPSEILDFCQIPRSLSEIMEITKYTSRVYFMRKILKPIIDKGLIVRTIPNTINNPNQKYVTKKDLK